MAIQIQIHYSKKVILRQNTKTYNLILRIFVGVVHVVTSTQHKWVIMHEVVVWLARGLDDNLLLAHACNKASQGLASDAPKPKLADELSHL